jgi:hypothetical protein
VRGSPWWSSAVSVTVNVPSSVQVIVVAGLAE